MLFNSVHFLWFLPLVVLSYYLTPSRWRWVLVLAASYTFYMFWRPEYIALVIGTTLVDYWAGLQMGKRETARQRLPFLLLSLGINLGLLITFKYLGFLGATSNRFLGTDFAVLQLLLPLGISFHTFQSVGYAIDVYRGKVDPERHLGYFAVFVAYFPQMVAGPIERYDGLGAQLHVPISLKYENFAAGFRLMLFGFFAKIVVADNLAPVVDMFYQAPLSYGRRDAAIAIFAYAWQIYGDFWGYTLIATGAARLLGVKLATNFKSPYLASSVADYWQRWHISLTSWFRDYLFTPLSLQLRGLRRWSIAISLLVTYLLSGFWHGANWTFIIWGFFWGLLYAGEFMLQRWVRITTPKPWSWGHLLRAPFLFVLSALVLVPFRSGKVYVMLQTYDALLFKHGDIRHIELLYRTWVLLGIFIVADMAFFDRDPAEWLGERPLVVRWLIYALLLFCVLAFGAVEEVPFIYFQF
jgi:alginate O-acetyltransferase complex protein AlgI